MISDFAQHIYILMIHVLYMYWNNYIFRVSKQDIREQTDKMTKVEQVDDRNTCKLGMCWERICSNDKSKGMLTWTPEGLQKKGGQQMNMGAKEWGGKDGN